MCFTDADPLKKFLLGVMKSLKESLFDKDLFDKGVVLDTDAAYEYFASILSKSDFVKHNNYDSPKRSYTIDRGNTSFQVTLMGHVSYSETSTMRGLDRIIDYQLKMYFDTYEDGCVINYICFEFSHGTSLEEEKFGVLPKGSGSKRYVVISSNNINEIFNHYVELFNKMEKYFHSKEFKDIVTDGKLDRPTWGLSNTLYNRRLKKYKQNKKQILNDLKKYIKS